MATQNFKWESTKQFSVFQLLLSFLIPSLFAFAGFRIVLPMLVKSGIPVLVAWPSIASVMLLVFIIAAVSLLRLEAKQLNISVASRMCLKKLSIKQWLNYIGIMFVGLVIAVIATQLVERS